MSPSPLHRRDWIKGDALGPSAALSGLARAEAATTAAKGKADACILLWLGGGAAQIDTFDPKRRGDGEKKPGSAYESISTAIPGVSVCEHLPRVARRLDRCVLVRSLHHKIIDEHAAATNLMHTGRRTRETVIYPS